MFHALSTHLPNRRSIGSVRSAAKNGHVLCNGKTLKEFKLQFAHLINEASKTTQFGFSNFGDNVHKIDMESLLQTNGIHPIGY